MKVDSVGNIYCAAPMSVWVISASGTKLAEITMPVTPSNCAWGDTDRKTLYITGGSSLYRIRLATATTSVKDQSSLRSQTIELHNNYPNPFNPTTQITYVLSHGVQVILEVYDVLGRRVAVLADEHQLAGTHEIQWNGDQFAAGVYLLRLQVDDVFEIQKMLLLK